MNKSNTLLLTDDCDYLSLKLSCNHFYGPRQYLFKLSVLTKTTMKRRESNTYLASSILDNSKHTSLTTHINLRTNIRAIK